MSPEEFDNQFDVLYNSITSNQAPGLNAYEKSVFLTKAQNEIILSYFDPISNKTQEGFDGSHRRQIDFSNITKVYTEYGRDLIVNVPRNDNEQIPMLPDVKPFNVLQDIYDFLDKTGIEPEVTEDSVMYTLSSHGDKFYFVNAITDSPVEVDADSDKNSYTFKRTFGKALFDMRKNSVSVNMPDMLLFINEKTVVNRKGNDLELVTVPIQFQEYDRLMSKPFKRPLKYQAWRIINNSQKNKADLVAGPVDTIVQYVARYLKKPNPIIVGNLDGLEIEGFNDVTPCELDPILHPDILQRAVEQAKASYSGGLQEMITLGQASQTDIGMLTQQR